MYGGLVVYRFPPPKPDTTSDRIAFGLKTYDIDTTIIKVVSDNSADFLKILLQVRGLHLQLGNFPRLT